jgi:hypothetical protein
MLLDVVIHSMRSLTRRVTIGVNVRSVRVLSIAAVLSAVSAAHAETVDALSFDQISGLLIRVT